MIREVQKTLSAKALSAKESMASVLDNPAIRDRIASVSVDCYHRMGEMGIYSERTELIRGVVIQKMVISPRHSSLVQKLVDWLKPLTPDGFLVRQEQPLTFSESEPEPDVAVVKGRVSDFNESHPGAAKLVIEVCVSSESIDRDKLSIYAEAGVEECWLVLAESETVEVFRSPEGSAYSDATVNSSGGELTPSFLPDAKLSVGELFRV